MYTFSFLRAVACVALVFSPTLRLLSTLTILKKGSSISLFRFNGRLFQNIKPQAPVLVILVSNFFIFCSTFCRNMKVFLPSLQPSKKSCTETSLIFYLKFDIKKFKIGNYCLQRWVHNICTI